MVRQNAMKTVTTLPNVSIELDGSPLSSENVQTLELVRVQQRLSLPAQCELTFLSPRSALLDELAAGTSLKVSVSGFQAPLFEGQVTAVEYRYHAAGTFLLHVRGYDALHTLKTRQSGRVYVEVTPQRLVEALTGDLGISIEAAESGPVYPRLIHDRASDFEVIRQVLDRCGLFMVLRGSTLHLITLEGSGAPVELALGNTLLEASVDINAGSVPPGVSVIGWDALGVETYSGSATAARSGRRIPADTAFALLMEEERSVINEMTHDEAEAQARAQAELDARTAGKAVLRGAADGDSGLMPGTRIDITGLAEAVCGQYVLTSVTHVIDHQRGYISEISTEPPTTSKHSTGTTITLGTVIQVDDPDGLGRVKVSLPAYEDAETEWLGVLGVGAGAGKGLIMLPNTNDTVLVLLAHENPGQGIVLGGMYGRQGAPEPGVEEGSVRAFTLMTSGGQRIQLREMADSIILRNDQGSQIELTAGKIRLENSDGSLLELLPERVHLKAARDLILEAPGKSLTLRAARIDLERG
jgi:phage protein D